MKIEIDLKEILHDEYGPTEDLSGSIRRQVIENLTSKLSKGLTIKIEEEINKQISDNIASVVSQKSDELVNDLIDLKYVPVDSYGRKGEETTFRNEILKNLQDQMQYKKTNSSWDRNKFTEMVDTVVSSSLQDFKKQFDSKVDSVFLQEAFNHAFKKLEEKFKVKS